jgi:hypothetical protein
MADVARNVSGRVEYDGDSYSTIGSYYSFGVICQPKTYNTNLALGPPITVYFNRIGNQLIMFLPEMSFTLPNDDWITFPVGQVFYGNNNSQNVSVGGFSYFNLGVPPAARGYVFASGSGGGTNANSLFLTPDGTSVALFLAANSPITIGAFTTNLCPLKS